MCSVEEIVDDAMDLEARNCFTFSASDLMRRHPTAAICCFETSRFLDGACAHTNIPLLRNNRLQSRAA
jgi:hypothetical protein